MNDVIGRMLDLIPIRPNMELSDPPSTLWIFLIASQVANLPDDPTYADVAIALAQIIKSERVLRSIPGLLDIAAEVIDLDNVVRTPYAIVQELDEQYQSQQRART